MPKNQRAATPDPEDRASGCICLVTSRVMRNQGQKMNYQSNMQGIELLMSLPLFFRDPLVPRRKIYRSAPGSANSSTGGRPFGPGTQTMAELMRMTSVRVSRFSRSSVPRSQKRSPSPDWPRSTRNLAGWWFQNVSQIFWLFSMSYMGCHPSHWWTMMNSIIFHKMGTASTTRGTGCVGIPRKMPCVGQAKLSPADSLGNSVT